MAAAAAVGTPSNDMGMTSIPAVVGEYNFTDWKYTGKKKIDQLSRFMVPTLRDICTYPGMVATHLCERATPI